MNVSCFSNVDGLPQLLSAGSATSGHSQALPGAAVAAFRGPAPPPDLPEGACAWQPCVPCACTWLDREGLVTWPD